MVTKYPVYVQCPLQAKFPTSLECVKVIWRAFDIKFKAIIRLDATDG